MVWPAVIGAVGALANTGLNSFLSGHSARAERQYNQEAAALQYYYQRELNKNAYQDTTYSMRQAGINPMLAISNGASTGSVGLNSVSVNSPQSDIVTPMLQAYSTAKQLKNDTKRVENETKSVDSTSKLNDYLGDKAHMESALTRENVALIQKYGDLKENQALQNLYNEGLAIQANTAKAMNDIKNSNAITASTIRANQAYVSSSAQANKNSAQALKASQREYDFYSKHPLIYGINRAFGSSAPLVNSAVKLAK